MQGKVHVFVGTSTLVLLTAKCPGGFDMNGIHIIPAIGILTAAAGSLAPDIDLARSSAGMKHKVVSKVASKVGGGHRGFFHTLAIPLISIILLSYIPTVLPYGVLSTLLGSLVFGWTFGYVMHLFADMFNGKGIPLFWPLMKGKVHILDIPSSGFGAWAFSVICVAFAYFLVFKGVI